MIDKKKDDIDKKIRKAIVTNNKEELYNLMQEYIDERVKYAENVIFKGIIKKEYINISS